MSEARPVIVTGMHRSGTSALARVVNILGVDFGPEDDFLPPKEDNPEGFWENRHLVQLHDDLLAQLGGRWQEPRLTDELRAGPGYEEFIGDAAGIVSGFEGERVGFKDPRASVLLDLWRHVWPDARVVVSMRHPVAVASSLERREGMEPGESARLWLRYTWDALTGYQDPVAVRYEDLLAEPETTVGRLAGDLALDVSSETVAKAVSTIDQARSSSSPDFDDGGEAMRQAVWLYEHFEDIPGELMPLVASGIREPLAVGRLRETESDLRHMVSISDDCHEQLRSTREEADHLAHVAQQRLEALEREERSRETMAGRAAELGDDVDALRAEVVWRRAVQYRFEKVLGKKGLQFLSGQRAKT